MSNLLLLTTGCCSHRLGEVERGAKTADHGDVLGSLGDSDETRIRALLDGYYDAGRELAPVDLESIY